MNVGADRRGAWNARFRAARRWVGAERRHPDTEEVTGSRPVPPTSSAPVFRVSDRWPWFASEDYGPRQGWRRRREPVALIKHNVTKVKLEDINENLEALGHGDIVGRQVIVFDEATA
jgi:hypothetical protein